MRRVAAIDCGTNSLRLLVADLDPATSAQTDVLRTMEVVRLGQGVDRTRRLDEAAVARTLAGCETIAARCADLGVEAVRFCATSASRDAENGAEFRAAAEAVTGARVEVLDGDEEAALAYAGAVRGLRALAGGPPLEAPVLVVDLGGGSTELVLGDLDGVRTARSLDVGSVRVTERHLAGDPATAEQVAAATADVDAVLDACPVDLASAATVVGVAGTVTTLAAHALGLTTYDSDAIHGARVGVARLRGACAEVLALSAAELRERAYVHPGRVDVIGGGALVLDRVLARVSAPAVLVSERDILDGIAWSLLRATG